MKVNQFSFLKMQLKTSFYDKLYYASERMHNSERAKQNNVKRIMKTALFLHQSEFTQATLAIKGIPTKSFRTSASKFNL